MLDLGCETQTSSVCLVSSSTRVYLVDIDINNPCIDQVVQEYERAVIFRLGRLVKGGAKVTHTF